jgi:hypothetical protein
MRISNLDKFELARQGSPAVATTVASVDSGWNLGIASWDGTTARIHLYNSTLTSGEKVVTTPGVAFSAGNVIYIGRGDNNFLLNADLAQLQVYNGVTLTEAQMDNVWSKERSIYGL